MDKPFSAYEGEGQYVFVCYAHADDSVVYPEIGWLRDQGINIWYDEGIAGGKVWRRSLAEAIQGASRVLYYVSKASLASAHCSREIEYAIDHEIEVVPVYLEEIALTPELGLVLNRVQALHRHQDPSYRQHILSALDQSSTVEFRTSIPCAGTHRAANWYRRTRIAIGLLVVLLSVMTAWFVSREPPMTEPASAELTTPGELTIEVRPLSVLNEDPALLRYAALVTRDIRDALANQAGLVLVSTEGGIVPNYALEGNVRAVKEAIRVSIELQNPSNGRVVWSEVLNPPQIDPAGVVEFQQALHVAYVVSNVLNMVGYEREFLESIGATDNQQALNAFFAGQAENQLRQGGDGNYKVAIDHLRRAIALDPQFAEPYARLLMIYAIRAQGTITAADARPESSRTR